MCKSFTKKKKINMTRIWKTSNNEKTNKNEKGVHNPKKNLSLKKQTRFRQN